MNNILTKIDNFLASPPRKLLLRAGIMLLGAVSATVIAPLILLNIFATFELVEGGTAGVLGLFILLGHGLNSVIFSAPFTFVAAIFHLVALIKRRERWINLALWFYFMALTVAIVQLIPVGRVFLSMDNSYAILFFMVIPALFFVIVASPTLVLLFRAKRQLRDSLMMR